MTELAKFRPDRRERRKVLGNKTKRLSAVGTKWVLFEGVEIVVETASETVVHGIELLHFCEPDEDCRYAINKPYVKNGYLAATDAKIMITFPSTDPDTVFDAGRKAPNPKSVLDQISRVEAVNTWPETFPKCDVCGLVKRRFPPLPKGCKNCKGLGEVRCNLGHEHDCEDCDGRGSTGGYIGHSDESTCNITIGGRRFDRQYISRINSLPGPLKYGIGNDMLVVHGPHGMIVVLMAFHEESGR